MCKNGLRLQDEPLSAPKHGMRPGPSQPTGPLRIRMPSSPSSTFEGKAPHLPEEEERPRDRKPRLNEHGQKNGHANEYEPMRTLRILSSGPVRPQKCFALSCSLQPSFSITRKTPLFPRLSCVLNRAHAAHNGHPHFADMAHFTFNSSSNFTRE